MTRRIKYYKNNKTRKYKKKSNKTIKHRKKIKKNIKNKSYKKSNKFINIKKIKFKRKFGGKGRGTIRPVGDATIYDKGIELPLGLKRTRTTEVPATEGPAALLEGTNAQNIINDEGYEYNGNFELGSNAGMLPKARQFRDIFVTEEGSQDIWDRGVGWFFCVCMQNCNSLRKLLVTNDVSIYSFKKQGNSIQLFEENRESILSSYMGGAGYRGITNFVAEALGDEELKQKYYAPRSHDYDTSFIVKNFIKDIDTCVDIICDMLILFCNMMVNELDRLIPDYWTKEHTDFRGNPIKFKNINELEEHANEKEELIWTHPQGHLAIYILKNKRYYNIRVNAAIQYIEIDERGVRKEKEEEDHIVELVLWNNKTDSAGATVNFLREKKLNGGSIVNWLCYADDKYIINPSNYSRYNYRDNFYGNYENYEKPEEYVPDIEADEEEREREGSHGYLDDEDYSPYGYLFTREKSINMTYYPTIALEFIAGATFFGLTGRSFGDKMPKCRQDFSRLESCLQIVGMWKEFEKTQGNIDKIKKTFYRIITPYTNIGNKCNWDQLTPEQQKNIVNRIENGELSYANTNYVQCRTYDKENEPLRELADLKFEFCKNKSDKECNFKSREYPKEFNEDCGKSGEGNEFQRKKMYTHYDENEEFQPRKMDTHYDDDENEEFQPRKMDTHYDDDGEIQLEKSELEGQSRRYDNPLKKLIFALNSYDVDQNVEYLFEGGDENPGCYVDLKIDSRGRSLIVDTSLKMKVWEIDRLIESLELLKKQFILDDEQSNIGKVNILDDDDFSALEKLFDGGGGFITSTTNNLSGFFRPGFINPREINIGLETDSDDDQNNGPGGFF
jgi:hypothetical protein